MKRDLGGLGLLSALLLNMVVWSISAVFWSVFSLDSEIAVIARFVCTSIWIVQFLYLIPIARHYRRKQEWEVVKGISVGAIVTIFINSTCYRLIPAGADDIPKIGAVVLTIAVMLITFYAFNRRSRPK
jgi:undecaprenyl pyrophosphate phosphatase UppP